MVHVHLILFVWRRPVLLEQEELELGEFIANGGRALLIAEFRRQLDQPLPKAKLPGDRWFKSHASENMRVIEPFDLCLVLAFTLFLLSCCWYVGYPAIEMDLLKVLACICGIYFAIYFGTLFLAFGAYCRWLEQLERKYVAFEIEAGSPKD